MSTFWWMTASADQSSPTALGFLRLMNALRPRPPFQVLVVSEESRRGREAIETAYALKQLLTAGVRVFFYLEDRERTLERPTDKIMLLLTAFADELEPEKARQRTYVAMLRKAKAVLELRSADWRTVLRGPHVAQARMVLQHLLDLPIRISNQPKPKWIASAKPEGLAVGLVQPVASLSIPSWNQLVAWLRQMEQLWEMGVFAA